MAEKLTHWKKLHNPDYLGVYALEVGKDLIATINSVANEIVQGVDGKKEECIVVHFKEPTVKPMILNATNAKMITKLLKSPYIERWAGARIQIYADYNIRFGKETVEGLRIRPELPAPDKPICAECGNDITAAGRMTAIMTAEYTQRKYGKPLCAACATKHKAAETVATDPLAVQDETTETEPKTEAEQEGLNNSENNENND